MIEISWTIVSILKRKSVESASKTYQGWGGDWALTHQINPATYLCACPKPRTCSSVVDVCYCFRFVLSLSTVLFHKCWHILYFRGLLQLALRYMIGSGSIVEGLPKLKLMIPQERLKISPVQIFLHEVISFDNLKNWQKHHEGTLAHFFQMDDIQ